MKYGKALGIKIFDEDIDIISHVLYSSDLAGCEFFTV